MLFKQVNQRALLYSHLTETLISFFLQTNWNGGLYPGNL